MFISVGGVFPFPDFGHDALIVVLQRRIYGALHNTYAWGVPMFSGWEARDGGFESLFRLHCLHFYKDSKETGLLPQKVISFRRNWKQTSLSKSSVKNGKTSTISMEPERKVWKSVEKFSNILKQMNFFQFSVNNLFLSPSFSRTESYNNSSTVSCCS